ncbi:hypothetical protein [Nocardia asiatica]|uniref:hypothetical protein n=1 Tax=Nocardia asiatica TaxID=209252 RepID=UPI003EE24E71
MRGAPHAHPLSAVDSVCEGVAPVMLAAYFPGERCGDATPAARLARQRSHGRVAADGEVAVTCIERPTARQRAAAERSAALIAQVAGAEPPALRWR